MSRNQKRFSGLRQGQADPKIAQLLHDAVENRAALTGKQRRDRARHKATYDLPPAVQAALQQVARREDTSASQIGEFLLAFALDAYRQRNQALMAALSARHPARTPRFSFNLEVPATWRAQVVALAQGERTQESSHTASSETAALQEYLEP